MRRVAPIAWTVLLLAGCAQHHSPSDGAAGIEDTGEAAWHGQGLYLCTISSARGGGWWLVLQREPFPACGEDPVGPVLVVFPPIFEPELEEGRTYDAGGYWVATVGLDGEGAEGSFEVIEWRPDASARIRFSFLAESGLRIEGEAVFESFCPAPVAC